jgi:site-specific recombinase XerD
MRTTEANLQPIAPDEATAQYLEFLQIDGKAEATINNREDHLSHFLRWCEQEGIDNLNVLDGRDLSNFSTWRREDGDLKRTSLRSQLSSLRCFLKWAANHEAVSPSLYEKVMLPDVSGEENRRDTLLEPERARSVLEYLETYQYASRDHVVFLILWATGMRRGALRALDVGDFKPHEQALELVHRKETGTPLKNKGASERLIALSSDECEVIEDYIARNREDVTDDHGREPLITTRNGRIGKSTIKRDVYRLTRPCVYDGECPHDREPTECDAVEDRHKASTCPSSVSTHPIRRGRITHYLDNGKTKTLVSDRTDVSPEVIDEFYDAADEQGKMERRRQHFALD